MNIKTIERSLKKEDKLYEKCNRQDCFVPLYDPKKHYLDLTNCNYYHALITLRHYIRKVSDYYFSEEQKAKSVDLFMLSPSISSPLGPGSDSEPIPIRFGSLKTYLVDSSQFGFEPLLLNGFKKLYCYLPSMRGEDFDERHLNQFYHCEFEMVGTLKMIMPIIEGYVKTLCRTILLMEKMVDKISGDPPTTKRILKYLAAINNFPRITFEKAIEILVINKKKDLIKFTNHGRDISAQGEIELMKILKVKTPLWVMYYDRDRVPFYQKPHPKSSNKVLNADLIFPPLIKNSFGGEIVGCGQRQNKPEEMYESLKRQKNLSPIPYEWYINIRRQHSYKITSGFGLGIERFITWALALKSIQDAIVYPRLKNIKTYP